MLFKNAFIYMKTFNIDKVLTTYIFYYDCEKVNIRIFPYLWCDFPIQCPFTMHLDTILSSF